MTPALSLRLLLVAMLYLSQFVANGFLYFGIGGVLREQGVELEGLAAFTALGLVWAGKALWAPLLDRFGPRRRQFRGWLLLLQPLMALSFLAFAPVPPAPEQLGLLLALATTLVVVSATQDIAADALVVRLMAVDERPAANGVQLAASYLGNVVGGGLFLVVYGLGGWVPAVLAVAAIALIPAPFLWTLQEPDRAGPRPSLGASFAALALVLRQRGALAWSALTMPLLYSGFAAGSAVFLPAFIDVGWTLSEVGALQSWTSAIAGPLGGLAAGWGMRRRGRRAVLAATTALSVAALAGLAAAVGGAPSGFAAGAVAALMASSAAAATIISSRGMDFTRQATPGTDFTMLSAVWMIVVTVESALALLAAASFGYPAVILAGLALTLLGAALLWRTVQPAPRAETVPIGGEDTLPRPADPVLAASDE
ncbi:Protein AmpG [Pseudoclavibacter triregionum]|nr:Protein AmpG [Pseudoclavibacter triregionum]